MRWTFDAAWALSLVVASLSQAAADTTVYRDAETGFSFSQFTAMYTLTSGIVFRIATPSPIPNSTFDLVLQVVAPIDVGWAGLAWGGTMTYNPLIAAWANGNNVVISSRRAQSHSQPQAFTGASYELLKTGTHVNRTHWQFTAKCSGCSSFTNSNGGTTKLNPSGSNRLAFAYSPSKPSTPSSNTSSFPVHDVANYWNHDFASSGNTAFASLVTKNGGTL